MYVVASLFGGIMPVPGGIGVMEAAVTVGLAAVGVPESAALASGIMFRIVTFYLPPLWGWFALHWLKNKRYLGARCGSIGWAARRGNGREMLRRIAVDPGAGVGPTPLVNRRR